MHLIVPPLPFKMGALEPYVSRRTLVAHYGRHHVAYVETARRLVRDTPLEAASLDALVRESARLEQRQLLNAAAQAWNHSFYWLSIDPHGGGEAKGLIAELIEASFGTQAAFRDQFLTQASEHLGSGWAWLVFDGDGLKIATTSNAGTALLSSAAPLLTVDLWEHAYYLDYQHRRADYLKAFMTLLVNWTFASANLVAAQRTGHQRRPRWESSAPTIADEIAIAAGAHR